MVVTFFRQISRRGCALSAATSALLFRFPQSLPGCAAGHRFLPHVVGLLPHRCSSFRYKSVLLRFEGTVCPEIPFDPGWPAEPRMRLLYRHGLVCRLTHNAASLARQCDRANGSRVLRRSRPAPPGLWCPHWRGHCMIGNPGAGASRGQGARCRTENPCHIPQLASIVQSSRKRPG